MINYFFLLQEILQAKSYYLINRDDGEFQRWRGVARRSLGPHMAARLTATMATKLEEILNKLLVADNAVIQEVSSHVHLQEESDVINILWKATITGCLEHMRCYESVGAATGKDR